MRRLNDYVRPHRTEIDERFHQLTCYNVLSTASFAGFLHEIEQNKIDGDIVECGIGRSRSLVILCSLVAGLGVQRRILAYDSFAGFPEPTDEDASSRQPRAGDWSYSPSGKYQYTEEFSRQVLHEAEVPLDQVDISLIKGFFGETLPHNDSEQIALLNINGDLYQSYKDCLENLYHKVAPGGILLFDDFDVQGRGNFPGARAAVREFLGDKAYDQISLNAFGVHFYVKP